MSPYRLIGTGRRSNTDILVRVQLGAFAGDFMLSLAMNIVAALRSNGAKDCLFVGGCVRDKVLGIPSKDIDIEVYGLSYSKIETVLTNKRFDCDVVGKNYGIIKVNNQIDVSIPRRDNKIGMGHKDFDVQMDPNMTPKEAALRRDFTINSLAMQPETEVIIDPFGGVDDIKNRVLRATSEAFKEDPLRVLRGMQFAARFGMTMEPKTVQMCRDIKDGFYTLAKERLAEEWGKLMKLGRKPSKGLELLKNCGWISVYPMIGVLNNTRQDEIWHPEGNVFEHTKCVMDAAVEIADREQLNDFDREILLFSALCHDLGKPATTIKNEEGRLVSPDHANQGVEPTKHFLNHNGVSPEKIDIISCLVREHMCHIGTDPTPRVIRRLANRLAPANMKLWAMLVEADHSGRPPLPKNNPVVEWQKVAASLDLENNKPKPILMGRHILEHSRIRPGPRMGEILKDAFEAQLDGGFVDLDGALKWFRERLDEIA